MAKNIDVIEAFVYGGNAKANNLRIEDGKLFNYNTVIAEKKGFQFYVNMTKYSRTTSTIQNKLIALLKDEIGTGDDLIEVYDVKMGATSLI